MQIVDKYGNTFGQGHLIVTSKSGKPKVPTVTVAWGNITGILSNQTDLQKALDLKVPIDRTITINGNTQDLSEDRTWTISTGITIGSTIITSGTVGRILFEGLGNVVQESANLSWDNASNILTLNGDINYTTYNRSIATSSFPLGTLFTQNIRGTQQINHSGGTNGLTIGGGGGSPLFRIWDSGNITIQTGGTYTDAGFKLDVIGTTRVTSLRTAEIFPASANITLWVNSLNSGSRFYTAPVHQDGRINFNAIAGSSDQVLIRAWHTGQFGLGTGSSSAGGALTIRGDSLLIGTSGSLFFMNGTFGPLNVPYRLGISTSATTAAFYSGVGNNQTNIESTKFEFTATSHTFYTGTTTGNQSNPNQFIPLHLSNIGNIIVGSTTDPLNTKVTISGNITASSGISRGANITNTIIAAANNDVLVGLDVQPTFTNGAFTGLANIDLRTRGAGVVIGSGAGYGAVYGYNNDGLFQFSTSGTNSVITLRPNNTAANYNSSYWSYIIQENYSFKIIPGNYQSLYLRNYSVSGAVYVGGRENANSYGIYIPSNTANVLINTTTDSGYKLDVNGTSRFTQALTVNAGGIKTESGTITGQTGVNSGRMTMFSLNNTGGGYLAALNSSLAIGFQNRDVGGLWSADFIELKVYDNSTTTATTGYNFYTHNQQTQSSASVLAMSIRGQSVGIGTENPSALLEVNGSARVQNGLTVSGSLNLNSSDISSAWTTYTPTWSTDGATQPSLGNGTITGAYKVIGKTVFVRVRLVFGTTTTAGTGTFYFSLPVNAVAGWGVQMPASILDNGNAWYQATVNGEYGGLTDRVALIGQSAGGANSSQGVTGVFPIGFGNTDSIQFNGSYESA